MANAVKTPRRWFRNVSAAGNFCAMSEQRSPRDEVAKYVRDQAAKAGLQLSEPQMAALIAQADDIAVCFLGTMDRDDRKQVRDLIERYGK